MHIIRHLLNRMTIRTKQIPVDVVIGMVHHSAKVLRRLAIHQANTHLYGIVNQGISRREKAAYTAV